MKIGINSSVTAKHFSMSEGIKELAELGFDCIDFSLVNYSHPNSNGNAAMRSDNWQDFAREVRTVLDDSGVEAYQTHALWGLYTDLKDYIPPEEQYFRQIKAAHIIGTKQLVFHPIPPKIRVNDIEFKHRVIEYNARWFRELVPCAEEYGVCIALENTFSHMGNTPGDGLFPFVNGESMNELADAINSKNITFCLDTGHANIELESKVPEMVRKLGNRLKVLHVQDNIGKIEPLLSSDLHMFAGYGKSNIEAICEELAKINFDGVMSLEPSHANMPLERWKIVMKCAVRMARYYASLAEIN